MPDRVGIMGGTFDPVHIGHLRVVEEAVETLELDALLFIPAASPPHKPDETVLPFHHRYEMLRLAVEGRPRFRVSDIERRLPGKSYTVNTLHKLREEGGEGVELFFLIGMDAFFELESWWRHRELFRLAHLVVLRRPGFEDEDVGAFLREKISPAYKRDAGSCFFEHPELLSVHCLHNTHFGVSSTQVRRLAGEGKSIRYLVLEEVMRYIDANCLYRPMAAIEEESESIWFRANPD